MYNKPKFKSMHSSDHIGHYRKYLCYLSHTQITTEIQSNFFVNWNTSVTANKGGSAFPSAENC